MFMLESDETDRNFEVVYEFKLRIAEATVDTNASVAKPIKAKRLVIYDEVLKHSFIGGKERSQFWPLMNTKTTDVFVPRTKYMLLAGRNRMVMEKLAVAKLVALNSSRSFLFSVELLSMIRENCKDKEILFLLDNLTE